MHLNVLRNIASQWGLSVLTPRVQVSFFVYFRKWSLRMIVKNIMWRWSLCGMGQPATEIRAAHIFSFLMGTLRYREKIDQMHANRLFSMGSIDSAKNTFGSNIVLWSLKYLRKISCMWNTGILQCSIYTYILFACTQLY